MGTTIAKVKAENEGKDWTQDERVTIIEVGQPYNIPPQHDGINNPFK